MNGNIYFPRSGGCGGSLSALNICPDPPTDETITRGPPGASGSPAENILDGRNVNSPGENKAAGPTEAPALSEESVRLNRKPTCLNKIQVINVPTGDV